MALLISIFSYLSLGNNSKFSFLRHHVSGLHTGSRGQPDHPFPYRQAVGTIVYTAILRGHKSREEVKKPICDGGRKETSQTRRQMEGSGTWDLGCDACV